MRKKGTPNKTYFNNPGKIKDATIKVRVSNDFKELFSSVSVRAAMIKHMSKSKQIRYLLMKGLLNYCHPDDIKKVQDELERT